MALKVSAYNSKKEPASSTDLVRFLYPDKNKRICLALSCSPQILVFPTAQENGVIRVNNSKKLPITKDGYFYYGAWPQNRVPPALTRKLNKMLKENKIREAGGYYDLAKTAAHEYELDKKRYVLIPDTGAWFEVRPIQWVYDFKTKNVRSYQGLWSSDELSPQHLKAFGWQAIQSNSVIAKLFKDQLLHEKGLTLREIESDMLHAVRFLRDKEKEAGVVSGKGQKIFDMLRRTFYQNQKRQK